MAEPQPFLSEGQRRMVGAPLMAGIALWLVPTLLTPADGWYWLALVLAPLLAGYAADRFCRAAAGRRLDAWLLRPFQAETVDTLPGVPDLPEPLRQAFERAALPGLLAHLAAGVGGLAPKPAAAARQLLVAGRDALGRGDEPALAFLAQRLPPAIEALLEVRDGADTHAALLAEAMAPGADRQALLDRIGASAPPAAPTRRGKRQ